MLKLNYTAPCHLHDLKQTEMAQEQHNPVNLMRIVSDFQIIQMNKREFRMAWRTGAASVESIYRGVVIKATKGL